jgi:hypothetical protein
VDLRLHDEHRSAQLFGSLDRFFDRERGVPARNRDAELREDGFGLVFVDVHEALGATVWELAPGGE